MYLAIIIGIIPFLIGTFYDFTVFLVALIFSSILLGIFIKNKKIKIEINNMFLLSLILFVFSLLGIFWAIDKNDAIIGTLRFLSLVIFSILLMQCKKEEKEKILNIIPYSGLLMLIFSIIIGFIPALRNIVYSESNRITGLFQYSNVFALYLLIGFIIITNKKKKEEKIEESKKETVKIEKVEEKNKGKNKEKFLEKIKKCSPIICGIILLIGILMTGSRTTFIITTIYIIYLCFRKENRYRKIYGITYAVILILLGIYVLITKNIETIGRIFTISMDSSTLLGRILYWKDGLNLLLDNIFGYGYMGYSYKIYEIQTGMYYTKFVHNDYLQMALDIGIIPLVIFIIFLVKSLFSKNNSKLNKIILISIIIHMFLEFDLQFMIIFYILLMCLEERTYKKIEIEKSITSYLTIGIVILVYGYYGVACFMNYIKQDKIAINMLGNFTEAKVNVMNSTENLNTANRLADEVLEKNIYAYQAYGIKAIYYLQNNEFEKMIEMKKKEIALDKYNPQVYEDYVLYLSQVLEKYAKEQNDEGIIKYSKYVFEVENMIQDVKNKTDKITGKLQDSSKIELNEETLNYINNIKEIIGKN